MKIEKKVSKLLAEHELREIMDHLISQAGLPKVLLQVSNRLLFKGNEKIWMKRAKLVHTIMEEIEKEEKPVGI